MCAGLTCTLPVLSQSKRPVESCRKAGVNLLESKAKDRKHSHKTTLRIAITQQTEQSEIPPKVRVNRSHNPPRGHPVISQNRDRQVSQFLDKGIRGRALACLMQKRDALARTIPLRYRQPIR